MADKNIKITGKYCYKTALGLKNEKETRALYILRTSII